MIRRSIVLEFAVWRVYSYLLSTDRRTGWKTQRVRKSVGILLGSSEDELRGFPSTAKVLISTADLASWLLHFRTSTKLHYPPRNWT